MRHALGLATVALTMTSCTHSHLARNAPGIADIATRPATDSDREPRDPGEQMVTFSYGAFGAGGFAEGGGAARGYYAVGPEVGLLYGTARMSHHDDDFFIGPEEAFGLNLGLSALTSEGRSLGPAYSELALRSGVLYGLGAGWAWDVNDRAHGPQLTLSFGPLFLRATHQLDTSTSLSVGLLIGGQHSVVWSR